MTTYGIACRNYAWNVGIGLTYMAAGGGATYLMERLFRDKFPNVIPHVKISMSAILPALVVYFVPGPKLISIPDSPELVDWALIAMAVTSMLAHQEHLAFFLMGLAVSYTGDEYGTCLATLTGSSIALHFLRQRILKRS